MPASRLLLPLALNPGGPGQGSAEVPAQIPPELGGATLTVQAFIADPGGPAGFAASAGLEIQVP